MPNVKSAAKRVKTNEKKNLRNRARRSTLRTAIRHLDEAIAVGDATAVEAAAKEAASVVGRTASKGVIHKKRAARLQSRLRLRANRALAVTAETE